jgi:uncharacterized membrane protein YgcG
VVWHYGTYGGLREFTIAYRAKGLVRRGGSGNDSDAIVLGVIPWGREWGASLGSLTVHVQLPKTASANVDDVDTWIAARGAARVSSRKITAAADDTLRTIRASAVDITSGEQVDMLVLLPAAASGVAAAKLPTSTEDLDTIRGDADDAVRDNTRRTKRYASLNSHPPGYWPTVATLLGLVLAAAFAWAAWRRTLREDPWPASVPRLLSDPPGELSPALAVSLVEQRLDAAPTALVATVFDLVRRGAYRTLPAQGDAKGARVDIALTRADRSGMEFSKAESKVLALVDAIVAGDPVAMGEFRDKLKRSRSLSTTVAGHQTKFEQHIADEIGWKRWFTRPHSGWITWPLLLGGMLLIVSILLVVWTGLAWSIGSDPRMTMNYGAIGAAFALAMLIVLGMVASARAVMTRYRSDARDEAARWCAYRDFLDSYGDMGDEQTASIEIWERHLVYAIAFGCAEDILSAVRPGAESPETEHGGIGSLSVMPIATFHSFSSGIATRAPQPSSSSGGSFGGGGGFSGGGGGGGGGAW